MYVPLLGEVSLWLLVLVGLLSAFYFYATSFVGVFKAFGIPGPAPWPIINHLPELRKHGLSKMLDEWRLKYGNSYGIYGMFPRCPTLVTYDAKLLEHIMVKDFSNFVDRVGRNTSLSVVVEGLFFLNGDYWRRSRRVMSPMFTVERLKQMLYHVNTSAALLLELIKKYKAQGKLIPLKVTAGKYTSDVVVRVGFSIDSKALTDDNSEFSYNINNFIRIPATRLQDILRSIGEFFPPAMIFGLKYFNEQVDAILPETNNYFLNLIKDSIDRKLQERSKPDFKKPSHVDMLDMLLDAEVDDQTGKHLKADDRKVTRNEVIGNSAILILAAYETTSTALTSILYLLARHPDIQDKLIEEVDEVMQGQTTPRYEDLSKLVYMTQVIYESLRMFPPSPDITRRALETRTYNGFTIPKGVTIFIPIYKIVKDPHYFPDPYKFDPERFSPQRKSEIDPVTFLPFGFGRRQCVAKRLALMELKVVLCLLLSNMRFIQTERTEPKIGTECEYLHIDGFFVPKKAIELDVVIREK
ncbi:cytochrome P450 3A4-like [Biomphalaria glabrata]|uniref:Cytochrome P450 3A4-like n=1 Tax=Biomphalaria glabrata TaxID=6526 RepID=A0A9W2YTF7_BIOGL|nr:cytochrome P450 3A4-like [Biomphalaria glabrata]XP_055865942.1 cytochrome P450 3A4-like [Biomphalaria glabrata]